MGLDRELDGFLVVSVEQAVAAPYCGLLLADAGARVIKVERPEGDFARGYDTGLEGDSVFFAWLNRGKESVALDFNTTGDVAVLREMLKHADVFLHNLAPGALERRGFAGDELREDNPKLITCELTGYGREGDAATKKAYDFLIQGESGLCSVTGTAETPSKVGISITDIGTGLTAFSAILRALLQRSRTGEGIDLSISMFDVIAEWMNMPLLAHRYLGGAPVPQGLTHAFIAPYGAFRTGDGAQVLLSIQNNREWASFCTHVLKQTELIEDPRFANNPDRINNLAALDALINDVFKNYARDDMLSLLGKASIACAGLNSVADLSEHPNLRNQTVQFGAHQMSVADLPVKLAGTRPSEVPQLDQHGAALRREFGPPD